MSAAAGEKDFFVCRKGMRHIGPLSRNTLRRYLAAGLIDVQTLVSKNDDRCMLPLGASDAACEITFTVRQWQRQFSLLIFLVWLAVMPLFSAFFAAWGVFYAGHSWCIFLGAILLAKLGMSYWLWRTWKLLLVDKSPATALFYALPMALPIVNIFWVWIGYMPLSKYYRRYRLELDMPDSFPYWLYYFTVILFYLMVIGIVFCFFFGYSENVFFIHALGCISWLWFGSTLLSLFIADNFTTRVIQKKLSKLAFGALQFGANIDYNVLHRTVLSIALSARRRSHLLALGILICSWLAGGWFWIHALNFSLNFNIESYWHMAEKCIICTPAKHWQCVEKTDQSTLVRTETERQGK